MLIGKMRLLRRVIILVSGLVAPLCALAQQRPTNFPSSMGNDSTSGSLIVLVAALNIISGLIMLVKDKSSDIAILRTMGASQGAIMRIFLITGASIGVVGTLTGFLVGTIICLNVESIRQFLSWLTNTELFSPELYFLSRLPAEMDPGETGAVVVMALTLSFLATLYPSWRAARLDPVDALRYE